MHALICRFRFVALVVAALIAVQPVQVGVAEAGMVGTETAIADETDDRSLLVDMLDREAVRDALVAHGVDIEEAQERIAAMSDAEVALLAGHVADDPAGEGLVGAVVFAGLIAFVVLLVADLTGQSDVF